MLEAGLVIIPSVVSVHGKETVENKGSAMRYADVEMEFTICHVSGAVWPEKPRSQGSGQDTGEKAVYKAVTGATKYFFYKFFNLATGDDPENDSGGNGAPLPALASQTNMITTGQYSKIAVEVKRCGMTVSDLKEILATDYDAESRKELTKAQAATLIDLLEKEPGIPVVDIP